MGLLLNTRRCGDVWLLDAVEGLNPTWEAVMRGGWAVPGVKFPEEGCGIKGAESDGPPIPPIALGAPIE